MVRLAGGRGYTESQDAFRQPGGKAAPPGRVVERPTAECLHESCAHNNTTSHRSHKNPWAGGNLRTSRQPDWFLFQYWAFSLHRATPMRGGMEGVGMGSGLGRATR